MQQHWQLQDQPLSIVSCQMKTQTLRLLLNVFVSSNSSDVTKLDAGRQKRKKWEKSSKVRVSWIMYCNTTNCVIETEGQRDVALYTTITFFSSLLCDITWKCNTITNLMFPLWIVSVLSVFWRLHRITIAFQKVKYKATMVSMLAAANLARPISKH